MLKKLISIVLIFMLVNLTVVTTTLAKDADPRMAKDARLAAKVRDDIQKLGAGENARVKLKLKDATKLEGYVSEAGEESFIVVNSKTGVATTVAYPQVGQIKGNNLSTRAKIAIGAGIAVAVIAVVILIAANDDIKFPNR
jgi:hypothetical protein